jgi:hypothetical protein
MTLDGLYLELYEFSCLLSRPSLHQMMLVELSTDGTISDLYTNRSVSNKICITNSIKQVANLNEPSC